MNRNENTYRVINELQKAYRVKMHLVYREIRAEAMTDPSVINIMERSKLTALYVGLLKEAETRIKDSLKTDGVDWVSNAWTGIGSRLEKPDFVYCDVASGGSIRADNVGDFVKMASRGKIHAVKYIPPAVAAIGIICLVAPNLPSLASIPFFVLGGALYAKIIGSGAAQDSARQKPEPPQIAEVTLDQVLDEQEKANQAILSKWISVLGEYAALAT